MASMAYGAIAQSAANIFSAIMQQIAAQKASKKMFGEYKDERARQKAYAEEAGTTLEGRLGTATEETAQQQMEQGAMERLAEFANMAKLNLAPTNNLMMTPQDKAAFGVSSKGRARLGSYSDWALQQAIQDIRTQQELNRVTSFAGGTAQVFPFKMYDAQHAYDWLANLGLAVQGSVGAGANIYEAWQMGQQGRPGQYPTATTPAPTYYDGDLNEFGMVR